MSWFARLKPGRLRKEWKELIRLGGAPRRSLSFLPLRVMTQEMSRNPEYLGRFRRPTLFFKSTDESIQALRPNLSIATFSHPARNMPVEIDFTDDLLAPKHPIHRTKALYNPEVDYSCFQCNSCDCILACIRCLALYCSKKCEEKDAVRHQKLCSDLTHPSRDLPPRRHHRVLVFHAKNIKISWEWAEYRVARYILTFLSLTII